ncbi:MAG: hypothetical protein IJF06_05290, partial [Bacteroidaceae bacterium]|nr:hypothetical protein [Bacteroidaceae bacterium]
MRKFLLSMALVLCTAGAMAQETTVEFRFIRENTTNLTEIPVVVIVNGETTTDITATLSATATNVDELQNLDASIVCFKNEGNGNSKLATEADPHVYTLTINGLNTLEKRICNISVLSKALNGSGVAQNSDTDRIRHFVVGYGQDAENLNDVEDRLCYISGNNIAGGTERNNDFFVDKGKTTAQMVVQLKMHNILEGEEGYSLTSNGGTANGCFFGLTGFKLTLRDYSYTFSQLTASNLMSKTEPTYIAMKNLSRRNPDWYAGTSSSALITDANIFVWEPTDDG